MFKIGDRVAFIDEKGEGRISKHVNASIFLVEDDDGFTMEYDAKSLVLIQEQHSEHYDRTLKPSSISKDTIYKKRNPVKHKRDEVEVDLHIEELVDDHRGWSNAEILVFQLEKFENVLNAAFQTRKRKMVVIHGRGDGVLRFEIRKKLQDYPGIEVHDASFKTYGQGATEILLHK